MYDYMIVGAGLYGAVFAHQKQLQGKKCLILEKRPHIGGNVFTKNVEGIDVHLYGPHITNTSNKKVWDFLHKFCDWNSFQYGLKANYHGQLFTLPFNLNTISEIFGISNPNEAKKFIDSEKVKIENPANLEEFALSHLGTRIYEMLIYGYTKKQWNKEPKELPASIIKRLPIRFNFNNSYYETKYQGVPHEGYSQLIEKLVEGVEVKTGVDFDSKSSWKSIAKNLIYTGPIDEFYKYKFGELEYRSLKFEEKILDVEDFQGCPVINYTGLDVDYTRVTEHKHFNPHKHSKKTIITYEYPQEYKAGKNIPYYPVNTEQNDNLYFKYRELANASDNLIISGRLGLFKYLNMDQIIAIALHDSK